MRAREKDIPAAALVTALVSISAATSASPTLRTLCGLLLVFYLPGYAILRAAFLRPRTGLAGAVFAVGLSIAVTVFCGFVLHLARGMTPVGWPIALGAVTLAACCVAHLRDRPASLRKSKSSSHPALTSGRLVMMACAIAIAASAVMLARQQALAHPEFSYTELWMVPHAEGRGAFTIGFKNLERASSSYDLEIMLDDRTVVVRRSIQLRVGEAWTSDFALPMGSGAAHRAEARLFRDGDYHLVYRRVWLRTGPET